MTSWISLCFQSAMLAVESQQVIALRLAKLAQGGPLAAFEAQRMVTEKMVAGAELALDMAGGGSPHKAIRKLRKTVQSNRRRLL